MSSEMFAAVYDDGFITEVIRPAAIVPEEAARAILVELALSDAQNDGLWVSNPTSWSRYDKPWDGEHAPGSASLVGTIHVAYGSPTRYEITIYRVTVTEHGSQQGWTVTQLCDEVLALADLSLATCPRASLAPPPRPFRF